MRVALGTKAHSGWAALVVVGEQKGSVVVVDRRRIELVEEPAGKAPYHAAEHMEPGPARELIQRCIAGAFRASEREVRAAIERARQGGHAVAACAVLVGSPMPAWSIEEIRAVHFRMHKAEGCLFRDALLGGAETCGVKAVAIPEKQLEAHAEEVLGRSRGVVSQEMTALGKALGPPWGKDQKDAALAARVALAGRLQGRSR